MAQFMMIMIGSAPGETWEAYIEKLIASGSLRGGSTLGNGMRVSKGMIDSECSVTGYIRLDVADMDEAKRLLAGNPCYESGGFVELLEEVPD